MRSSAIVVAAGRGTRMGGPTAKAFLTIGGTPTVVYSLRTISRIPELTSIVLVVAADCLDDAATLVRHHGPWPVPVRLARGGMERQDSVAAGLALLDDAIDLVIVHDAARPFVSLTRAVSCLRVAQERGAAILATRARDTVKLVGDDGTIVATLDRQRIWLAQTPQVFRLPLLQQAHARAKQDGYTATDDAALVERLGATVCIVPGDEGNRKITTPDDLRWAEWYLPTKEAKRD